MTAIAITMMIIAIFTVWGGLAWALLNLKRHPEDQDTLPAGHAPEL